MCYVISCAPRVLVCRDVRAGNNDMWANAKTIKIVLAPLSSVLLLVVVEERVAQWGNGAAVPYVQNEEKIHRKCFNDVQKGQTFLRPRPSATTSVFF